MAYRVGVQYIWNRECESDENVLEYIMLRSLLLGLSCACFLIPACSHNEDINEKASVAADPVVEVPLPTRRIRTGPPDFSTIEPELVRYADWFGRMTDLQEQEALAKNDGPIEDFGRKLVGRSFRFMGRVADVEHVGGRIVVHMNYQPMRKAGRVEESGEKLQRIFYSDEEWKKRRAWRVSISLPDDAATRKQADLWGKSQWLAFDGRVEGTDGFQLKRDGTKALFAANDQIVHVSATSGAVQGDCIGPGSRIAIMIDASGSMVTEFNFAKRAAMALLQSLPQGAVFNVTFVSDARRDGIVGEWRSCTSTNVAEATATINDAIPEGQTDMASALSSALQAQPTHLICITDGDFNGGDARVVNVLRRHPDTRVVFVVTIDLLVGFGGGFGDAGVLERVQDDELGVLRGEGLFIEQIREGINVGIRKLRDVE